jgi:hypothetical protein
MLQKGNFLHCFGFDQAIYGGSMLSKPPQPSTVSQSDIEFECLLFLAEAQQSRQEQIVRLDPLPQPQTMPRFARGIQVLRNVLRKSDKIRVA